MSSNFREIIKKLIPVFGEKARQRATQATPHPPARCLNLVTFTRGENAELSRQAPNPAARLKRRIEGGGGNSAFLK